MKKALSLIIAVVMCVGMFAVSAVAGNPNYTQNWNNGKGTSTFTNISANQFSTTWSSNSGSGFNGVVGKGWNPGTKTKVIGYNVSVFQLNNPSGCAYLSLYGWTRNTLVEYYVMEMWINYKPATGTKLGTISSNGGTYDVWKHQQVNQPSIQGTQSFWQIFSLRQAQAPMKTNNTLTFPNHVNGWSNLGFNLGSTMDYQMMAVEFYESSGSADLTVWEITP